MNVEIRKHGMYSQYIPLCGFFLSVEFFDMFKDINNLERKKSSYRSATDEHKQHADMLGFSWS